MFTSVVKSIITAYKKTTSVFPIGKTDVVLSYNPLVPFIQTVF